MHKLKNRTEKNNKKKIKFTVSKLMMIVSAWIFQGFLYMNIYEKAYKIILETLLFSLIFTFFLYVKPQLSSFVSIIYSFLIAHTIVWFFNGQVMTMFIHMGIISNKPKRFIAYTDKLVNRILSKNCIRGAAIFGSITKCHFKKTSDLDVRLIMKKGIINRLLTCHFCFVERCLAFFQLYPIDIFAFDLNELKDKMSTDEDPIIICDRGGQLRSLYQSFLNYETLRKKFRAKYM